MQKVDSIVHAKWIWAANHAKLLTEHGLVLNQGKIIAILPSKEIANLYQTDNQQFFNTHALLPGFINSHTHLAMNYFRGLADDLALMDWLNHHIWPAEKKWVNHEFVRDASLFAMAEMILSGSTCFNDMYFFLEATAEAATIAGLRANIGITVIEFPTAWASTTDEYLQKGLAFYEQYHNHSLIRATLAPHAPYTVSDESFIKIKKIAEQHRLKINLHLHETQDEVDQSLAQFKKRPIQRLHDLGVLSPDLIAIHMTALNEEDFAILEKTKPQVIHCPESNMKLASGVCPIETLKNLNINVALGTDGAASNNDLNMLGEMRTAAFLAKLTTARPDALNVHDNLLMATLNGAKALGIDNITGSLAPNKAADFIAVKLDELETLPLYHPLSQIVYAASRRQVTDVWVAGKQLLKNRQLTTLNEQELKEKVQFWSKKISN